MTTEDLVRGIAEANEENNQSFDVEDNNEATAEPLVLDLSLLVINDLSGKVKVAAGDAEKYAELLADAFGQTLRTNGMSDKSWSYPVKLTVPVSANVPTVGVKKSEMQLIAEWLDQRVMLGSDKYRWAITPNGTDRDVFLKIVRKREKNVAE
jgi:hypothetical protein